MRTQLVLAGAGGVTQYSLDRSIGEFRQQSPLAVPTQNPTQIILSAPNSTICPEKSQSLFNDKKIRWQYSGLPALDCYQVLLSGGLWVSRQDLGLLYQGLPLAFIAERAGAILVPDLLEKTPDHIHQQGQLTVKSGLQTED